MRLMMNLYLETKVIWLKIYKIVSIKFKKPFREILKGFFLYLRPITFSFAHGLFVLAYLDDLSSYAFHPYHVVCRDLY